VDVVTAQSYAGYDGFGMSPFGDVEALHKALTAGTGTDAASYTNGRSLIVESLENTLMVTTFSMEDIRLFKDLKTNPIFAVIDEWTEKSSYGNRYGVAVGETENPASRDSVYARKIGQAKFYRTKREVSHVMTLMKGIVDAEAEEQVDGTMLLVQQIESALFYGNSSIITEEFDGLKRLIETQATADNIIDVRGVIDEAHLQQGAKIIRKVGFGVPTDAYLSLDVQTDIDRILETKHRITIPMMGSEGGLTAGAPVDKYRTSFGTFNLKPEVFITEDKAPFAAPVGDAPTKPSSVTAVASSQVGSKFLAADAGTYWYGVAYFTKSGESDVRAIGSAVTVAAGDKVTLTINGGTTTTVTGCRIFRSMKNAADATDMLEIAQVLFTASGMTNVDINNNLPGSSEIFLCNLSPNYKAISWQQLLPMMKLPLAITGPSLPFLIMLYGYLRLTKPKQFVMLKNIRPSDHRFNQ
jgi:hypothetical protein